MECARGRRTIASVELIRFMCHEHLVINLRKPLTVVAGGNGSGKSAVMVAIGLALGQRTQHLERGSSFRGLIKNKETSAVVRVVLDNHKGFRPDFFKETIVIEKRIGMRSSTTSVMNGDRRVWSTRREDLEEVLEVLGLRLENPLNFLTQEHAKRFLSTMDAGTLYELFMKGTEMEEICRLNKESLDNVEAMARGIEAVSSELQGICSRIESEESCLSAISNARAVEATIGRLEDEMLWAGVSEKRAEMERSFDVFRRKQEEMERYAERRDELSVATREVRERICEIESSEAERKRRMRKRRDEIEEAVGRLRARWREIGNDCEELREARDFKSKIASEFERQEGMAGSQRDQVEDRHEGLVKEMEALRQRMSELEAEREECRKGTMREEEAASERRALIQQLRRQAEVYARDDRGGFFGAGLSAAMSEISKTRFREEVVGPVAFEVKLKEQRWARAVSVVLNNALSTFIVLNKADRDMLLRIFRRHGVDFPISTLSSKEPRVVRYKSNERYKSVLDVLEIRSPFVANYLIITASVEQTILVEDRKEAYGIIRGRPGFVECAYTRGGDKIRLVGGSMSDFVVRGVDRFYFENGEERLKKCKEELARLEKERAEGRWGRRLKEVGEEMERVREEMGSADRMCKALRIEMDHARRLDEAQAAMGREDELHEEIRGLSRQIELLEKKRDGICEEIEALAKEDEEICKYRMAGTEELRSKASRYDLEAEGVERKLNSCRLDALRLKEEHQRRSEAYNLEKSGLLEQGKEEVVPRAEDEIRRELAYAKAHAELCREGKDEQSTRAMLLRLRSSQNEKEGLLQEYEEKTKRILEDVESRIARRDCMRREIAEAASKEFSRLTKTRGYEGTLEFDHVRKALDVRMRVHGQAEAGSRSMLSGGERSFASVSLLLSLWASISCPVKILDEFDVFMDDLNRKHAIKLLLSFFKESSFQGILITPLGIEDLFEDFCDVVMLGSPRSEPMER